MWILHKRRETVRTICIHLFGLCSLTATTRFWKGKNATPEVGRVYSMHPQWRRDATRGVCGEGAAAAPAATIRPSPLCILQSSLGVSEMYRCHIVLWWLYGYVIFIFCAHCTYCSILQTVYWLYLHILYIGHYIWINS